MSTVKLKDIAKAANVSVSAVSKALANSPEIGEATKKRIATIADEMGYSSNYLAKSLRLGRSNLLGVILPDNTNPFYSNIIQGIEERAKEAGFNIIVANSSENDLVEIKAVQTMMALPVEGVLASPVKIENYACLNTKLIFLSRFPYQSLTIENAPKFQGGDHNYVVNNDFEGQRLATLHLLEQGIRDICIMLDTNDPENASTFKTYLRLDGYIKALEEYKVPYRPNRVFFGIHTIGECYEAVSSVCKNAKPPIGFCISNDFTSIGALKAIGNAGLSIPEQAKVVGYGDIELANYLTPPLTSIHSANKELGIYGTNHLLDFILGKMDEKHRISIVLKPYLEKRQST